MSPGPALERVGPQRLQEGQRTERLRSRCRRRRAKTGSGNGMHVPRPSKHTYCPNVCRANIAVMLSPGTSPLQRLSAHKCYPFRLAKRNHAKKGFVNSKEDDWRYTLGLAPARPLTGILALPCGHSRRPTGLQKAQHRCRGFEFGETEGAAFERERITAPLLHVPILVDVRRLPGFLDRQASPR
jgi:hypothetical protein